ncbi:hypothetical protein PR048_027915 [Dryococelus australis]|uniref:Uncharacterized protein n=1 Tax=Dryococelus australis TaxID=614101 RepID=A0ABQ9GHS6_9NEOP|nr:hypothetical protein PR048_027915 [Dryococelus australis]
MIGAEHADSTPNAVLSIISLEFRAKASAKTQRNDGNTARLARWSDETLDVRVTVARIAPLLLYLADAVAIVTDTNEIIHQLDLYEQTFNYKQINAPNATYGCTNGYHSMIKRRVSDFRSPAGLSHLRSPEGVALCTRRSLPRRPPDRCAYTHPALTDIPHSKRRRRPRLKQAVCNFKAGSTILRRDERQPIRMTQIPSQRIAAPSHTASITDRTSLSCETASIARPRPTHRNETHRTIVDPALGFHNKRQSAAQKVGGASVRNNTNSPVMCPRQYSSLFTVHGWLPKMERYSVTWTCRHALKCIVQQDAVQGKSHILKVAANGNELGLDCQVDEDKQAAKDDRDDYKRRTRSKTNYLKHTSLPRHYPLEAESKTRFVWFADVETRCRAVEEIGDDQVQRSKSLYTCHPSNFGDVRAAYNVRRSRFITTQIWLKRTVRTAVADTLACSPPTKANRVESPGRITPEFRIWESYPNDAAGQRVFTGISRFPLHCIPALLHSHFTSPSSALKTSLFRAAQISQLNSTQSYATYLKTAKPAENKNAFSFSNKDACVGLNTLLYYADETIYNRAPPRVNSSSILHKRKEEKPQMCTFHVPGGAVARALTSAIRVHSRIFACGNRAGRSRLQAGFLGVLPPLHSSASQRLIFMSMSGDDGHLLRVPTGKPVT